MKNKKKSLGFDSDHLPDRKWLEKILFYLNKDNIIFKSYPLSALDIKNKIPN